MKTFGVFKPKSTIYTPNCGTWVSALAELSTRQIAESVNAVGMEENEEAGKKGGGIAKKARLELEEKTGKRVVSSQNFLPPKAGKKLSGK